MAKRNDVEGRIGDVSGRIGNVSGRIGDVSGRIGDVSGIEGRIGDVSGDATLQDVKDLLISDRGSDRLVCLELKIRRLENEVLGIARWLDMRLRVLEGDFQGVRDDVTNIDTDRLPRIVMRLDDVDGVLVQVDERLKKLETRKQP
jgi:hypothetical protein